MAYEGFVDFTSTNEVSGWVFESSSPNDSVDVEILAEGKVIAKVPANTFRADLAAAGKGNGNHAFRHSIRTNLPSRPLEARVAGLRWNLQRSQGQSFNLAAHLAHTMEYGLPAADYAFGVAVPSADDEVAASRLIAAYHRTIEDDPHHVQKSDVWSGMTELHMEIADLVRVRDIPGTAKYLRDAHAKGLTHGITQGKPTYEAFQANPAACKVAIGIFLDYLASLAEYIGVLNVECPEQNAPRGVNSHRDPAETVADIEARLGISVIPPSVVGSALGIKVPNGVLTSRDIFSLYAALRLQSVATELGLAQPSICEIGGGLGGVAYFANRLGIPSYTIIDLPLVSLLQGYFLLRALPDVNIRLYGEPEGSPAAISLLPTYAFSGSMPQYDVLFNQDSIPEMHTDYSLGYLKQALRNVRHAFLSINQEAQAPQSKTSRQAVVGALTRQTGGYRQSYRFRHWLRAGYVEELFRIEPDRS